MTRVLTVLSAVLLAVLAVAGCGVRPSGVIPGLEAPAGPSQGAIAGLFFLHGRQLVQVHTRPDAPGQPGLPGADVIGLLAAGPDADGRAKGLTTEVPSAAAPGVVRQTGTGLDVRLQSDVGELTPMAVDQIVCTLLLQYPHAGAATLRGGGNTTARRTCPVTR